jgi:hypothetical protein
LTDDCRGCFGAGGFYDVLPDGLPLRFFGLRFAGGKGDFINDRPLI